jgi:hypothetical protein
VSLDEETSEFSAKSTFDHPYPTTKIMWIPDTKGLYPDLLATSGGTSHSRPVCFFFFFFFGPPQTLRLGLSVGP